MKYRVFSFLLLALYITDNQGQSTSLTDFIDCVELQNGSDNLLMNGRPYLPANPKADPHPYFQTKEWKSGVVHIHGNPYSARTLKYNLSSDQLILKHERPNGTSYKVVLSGLLVDSFQIEDHNFINRTLIFPVEANSGYLEKIFEDKLSFFRHQKKVLDARYDEDKPFGQYSNLKDIYYLLHDDQPYKITKKKQFLACFPNHMGQIKKYIKGHSLHWNKLTKVQFFQLLKFCNDQI